MVSWRILLILRFLHHLSRENTSDELNAYPKLREGSAGIVQDTPKKQPSPSLLAHSVLRGVEYGQASAQHNARSLKRPNSPEDVDRYKSNFQERDSLQPSRESKPVRDGCT